MLRGVPSLVAEVLPQDVVEDGEAGVGLGLGGVDQDRVLIVVEDGREAGGQVVEGRARVRAGDGLDVGAGALAEGAGAGDDDPGLPLVQFTCLMAAKEGALVVPAGPGAVAVDGAGATVGRAGLRRPRLVDQGGPCRGSNEVGIVPSQQIPHSGQM